MLWAVVSPQQAPPNGVHLPLHRLGDNEIVGMLAQRFLRRVSKYALRGWIPRGHSKSPVPENVGDGHAADLKLQAAFTLPQAVLSPLDIGDVGEHPQEACRPALRVGKHAGCD